MKAFARSFVIGLSYVVLLSVQSSCVQDNAKPQVNPTIEFLTSEGYTYLSDTVPPSDTLRVGVVIQKGDDQLRTFKVLATYDNDDAVVADSLPMGTETFEFDKTIVTRAQAGTEKWTFWVQENDGDVIKRSLTFTVE